MPAATTVDDGCTSLIAVYDAFSNAVYSVGFAGYNPQKAGRFGSFQIS